MKLFTVVFLLIITGWSSLLHATITCTRSWSQRTDFLDTNAPVVAEGVNISALRDLPVGGVLFRQTVKMVDPTPLGFYCRTDSESTETTPVYTYWTTEGALPAITGTYSGHNAYNTGIPGIGVAIIWATSTGGNYAFPYSMTGSIIAQSSLQGAAGYYNNYFLDIVFVKTGDIPAGVWNVPVSLPPIIMYREAPEAQGVNKEYGLRIHIAGSVNVVAGTCETPDVVVPMGQNAIDGSVVNTRWVDFSVNLLSCPPMYGRYDRTTKVPTSATNQWLGEGVEPVSGMPDTTNAIKVLLNPVEGYETLASGGKCAKLTSSSDMAGGACLEIQNASGANVLTSSFSGVAADSGLSLLSRISGYTIPLKARYGLINGNTAMSAGKADSAVEFTINYQ
ncbi:fimbrial protein [Entomohabitans teleogrylli]|uniref:fimbrial protein n=1 Tax=Entomohabitans teleogrylli TaxID=1384589 RepID=UPI000B2F4C38|nr:type 1 fimbrial protein [Entomohabitans teleogrylli]